MTQVRMKHDLVNDEKISPGIRMSKGVVLGTERDLKGLI